MADRFGAYLIIPLKYEAESFDSAALKGSAEPYAVTTMDVSECVKNMFGEDAPQSVGAAYKLCGSTVQSRLCGSTEFEKCSVVSDGAAYDFSFVDSYLYVFHTRIAFLCLGISFATMDALSAIVNPGYAENSAEYVLTAADGSTEPFSLNGRIEELAASFGMDKFYNKTSSVMLESYTYILSLHDEMFPDLESLRRTTFQLHQMRDPECVIEDDSEEDVRYVYGVRNSRLNGYRWGCCVTSQTIAYAVAEPGHDGSALAAEMAVQAADGLPLVMLAMYEKYTCLRFTELISETKGRKWKYIQKLKRLMLDFQAFGFVTPANLSRWHNVKQIYSYLLEVNDIRTAVEDISAKLEILVAQQQELENVRSTRIINLITIFGVVGILSSVQSIVDILYSGGSLMWSVTLLTTAIMALCFGLALRK